MAYQETMLEVRGLKIQLLQGGTGKPLLYLHSAGGEVVWLPFFEALSQHFTLYVPAHPGFGRSEGLEKMDSMEDWVFHYMDLIDSLGLEGVHVVGLSLGGWLAAELATHYAHRLGRLVLIDAVGLRVEGAPVPDIFAATAEETRRLVFFDPDSELAKSFIPDNPPMELLEMVLRAREAAARIGWNPYLHNPKLPQRLHRIALPTLILWGDSDRLVPLEHGRAYQRGIAGSRLTLVERCGHAPPLERPQETAKLVVDFLRESP